MAQQQAQSQIQSRSQSQAQAQASDDPKDDTTQTSPIPNNHNEDATTATTATTQLSEAIDAFLNDVETRIRVISEEVLTKLDDMAEKCDRLEMDMLASLGTTNPSRSGSASRSGSTSRVDDSGNTMGRKE